MNIFLIGYMGVGKSAIGSRLAARLGVPFLDLDTEIAAAHQSSIPALFADFGEAHFREIEKRQLEKIIDSNRDFVLATGGGTACSDHNINLMLLSGVVVWLQLSPKINADRLSQGDGRPLIEGLEGEELLRFITDHLKSREPFYAQAHLSFDANNVNGARLDELSDAIRHFAQSKTANQ